MRESMMLVPMVVEQSARGERSFDIYSRLLRDDAVADQGKRAEDAESSRQRSLQNHKCRIQAH
jgi:hypothetical protein